jgi:hypothetical protein
MPKYIVFSGTRHPLGGGADSPEGFDDELDAVKAMRARVKGGHHWAHVLYTPSMEIIEEVKA